MEIFLYALLVIAVFGGAIFFNKLRCKMYGIVGVGGSYVILMGIMLLCSLLLQLFTDSDGIANSKTELLGASIVMVVCLGYMVFVMLTRCDSALQRILLPFAACMIGGGFILRLLCAIVLHIPMGDGVPETAAAVFPHSIISPDGETFELENDSGDNATYYCSRTGQRAHFRDVDFTDGFPTGWYQA